MTDIEKIDFHGFENLASGRLYIWSRTLPLLKKYFLLGCGMDNFYLVYPQNDYIGKARYCRSPYTIVEKPHNTALLIAVEQGVIAFLLLAGMGIYIWRKCSKKSDETGRKKITTWPAAASGNAA